MTESTDVRGVLTRTPAGTTVRFERRYATGVDDLWSCLTDPGRVARWLGPLYGDLRVGGAYELRMEEDVAGSEQNATGEVLVCDRPQRLEVTWVFPDETSTLVTVDLRADGDGTVLVLEHRDLQEAAARGYGGGWHACLDQLEDHVAGRPVRAWQDRFDAAVPLYREG